jgi:hypothetical protein
VKRRVITVPAADAGILEIGEDCESLGQPGYVVEKIGEEFTDNKGWKMVEITLVETAEP